MNSSHHRTLDQWREIVSGHAVSRLNIAAYCRQLGISQQSFFNWRRRFGRLTAGRFGSDAGKSSAAFVEVKTAPSRSAAGIQVRLRGGRRLVVSSGFDRELLAQVIEALEALA